MIYLPEKHEKTWGHEEWAVNKDYCGKMLVVKAGWQCSLHKHKKKDEVFMVASGVVFMEVGDEESVMMPGRCVHIPTGVLHRFSALMPTKLIEFSSHHEEEDSYREIESRKIPRKEYKRMVGVWYGHDSIGG